MELQTSCSMYKRTSNLAFCTYHHHHPSSQPQQTHSLSHQLSSNTKFTMKAFTIVLGLFAAVAVSDVVSAASDVATCGNHRAVRCIGLKGDALEDTDATMLALKKSSNERVCECQRDKSHLYVVAENNEHFIQIMNECKTFAYRGKTCIE